MCKGLAALPATCLKSAKDMKHRIGFLLQKPDSQQDQSAANPRKEKITLVQRIVPAKVKKWGQSFDSLLKDDIGLTAFKTFLKSEFSEENIDFWMACEDYKITTSQEERGTKAKQIFQTYLDAESPKEVNLDSATREKTRRNLSEPSFSCFEEAQKKIFQLMEDDSYRRFLKSKQFLSLLQEPGGNKTCGMAKGLKSVSEFNFIIPLRT